MAYGLITVDFKGESIAIDFLRKFLNYLDIQ